MSDQTALEANYENLALLLAGVVSFLEENASNQIPVEYFNKDYSTQQVAVIFDEKSNEFVFQLKGIDADES